MKLTRLISAGCALTFAAIASAGGLTIGDQAPDLGKDVTWIKGDSVPEFEKGHVYVLDFWATWCSPCVRAIPHMDEVAEKHEADGVTVIGVAIWPNDRMTPTAEFVKDKGDDMSYTIAADISGATARKFMDATGSNGIPTVMIVDREGVLAWVGHPMPAWTRRSGRSSPAPTTSRAPPAKAGVRRPSQPRPNRSWPRPRPRTPRASGKP